MTRRFHVLTRAHRMYRRKRKFQKIQRRLITAYFCADNEANLTRFREYGLEPRFEKKQGWSLLVTKPFQGITSGTVINQDQLFAVVFGDMTSSTPDTSLFKEIKDSALKSLKEKTPIQSAKLAAGYLAFALNPAAFGVVMAVYGMARTINGSRNYLWMRDQYDKADPMMQSFMVDKIFSPETLSRISVPAVLDVLTLGLLDNSVTDDLQSIISSVRKEVDIGIANDVSGQLSKTSASRSGFAIVAQSQQRALAL